MTEPRPMITIHNELTIKRSKATNVEGADWRLARADAYDELAAEWRSWASRQGDHDANLAGHLLAMHYETDADELRYEQERRTQPN